MKHFLFLLIFCTSGLAQAQDAAWEHLGNTVNVSFASSNNRFAQDKVPVLKQQATEWKVSAWKGEKVHTQILVWAGSNISTLKVKVGDLLSEKGNLIRSQNLSTGFLRYVLTDAFANGCGARQPQNFDSSLVADPIDPCPTSSLNKNQVQPIWLSVVVPASCVAGKYKGIVRVIADKVYTLNILLEVLDRTLPPASDWKFDLDLWQHPAAIARVHKVALWSKAHYALMKPYYTLLANAGQKSITTSIIHEPWNHQTYDDFPSLIKWIKKKDGSWQYDYSLFDQYVTFVMSCGIKARINCYTMIPWKLSFQYYDQGTARDTVLTASPGSKAYNDHWLTMLNDFTKHLKAKEWFDITSISMDERAMKDMQAVIKLVKTVDPAWKITLAGDYHPEIEKDIYDYSVALRWQLPDSVLTRRKVERFPTTFYTCCVEPYPNGFTFSPPAENTWLGWYAAAKGFTGYLRWAYNSWPHDALHDSRFTAWPAGDTFKVYPGPMSSIRFEKLIEGIQDFEKIRLIKEQYANTVNVAKLKELELLLQSFTIENLKIRSAAEMTENAKLILNSNCF